MTEISITIPLFKLILKGFTGGIQNLDNNEKPSNKKII
jgi:hypothetical protein